MRALGVIAAVVAVALPGAACGQSALGAIAAPGRVKP